MGIGAKHTYRFKYLKSEHWKNLRIEKLATEDAKCEICQFRSLSNDVHHLKYRRPLTKTTVCDLVVLCRRCHELVHGVIGIIKKGPKIKGKMLFFLTKSALKLWINESDNFQCKICGIKSLSVHARNGIKRYVPMWDYSKWMLCDSCFNEFVKNFKPPAEFKSDWQFFGAAKQLREDMRNKKLLTTTNGETKGVIFTER